MLTRRRFLQAAGGAALLTACKRLPERRVIAEAHGIVTAFDPYTKTCSALFDGETEQRTGIEYSADRHSLPALLAEATFRQYAPGRWRCDGPVTSVDALFIENFNRVPNILNYAGPLADLPAQCDNVWSFQPSWTAGGTGLISPAPVADEQGVALIRSQAGQETLLKDSTGVPGGMLWVPPGGALWVRARFLYTRVPTAAGGGTSFYRVEFIGAANGPECSLITDAAASPTYWLWAGDFGATYTEATALQITQVSEWHVVDFLLVDDVFRAAWINGVGPYYLEYVVARTVRGPGMPAFSVFSNTAAGVFSDLYVGACAVRKVGQVADGDFVRKIAVNL